MPNRAPRGIVHDDRQIPLITPDCPWSPPRLGDLPSTWRGARRVAIDTETRDEHLTSLGIGVRRGGYMVGFSFAIEGGPKHYLPFRHLNGDNLDPDMALDYIRVQLRDFDGELVGSNLPYDLDYLWGAGCETPNVHRYRDIQVADPLLDEHQMRYGLEAQGRRYFDEGKDTSLMLEAAGAYGMRNPRDLGKWIWRLPGRYVGQYAEQDADLPLRLIAEQERRLEAEDLLDVYDLESRVLPALLRMRRRGIRWDHDASERAEQKLGGLIDDCLAVVRDSTGVALSHDDLTKPHAQKPVLDYLGVEVPLTPKTREPSIDKDLLKSVGHKATDALQQARAYEKARRDYVVGWRRFVTNGRVHATLNQMLGEDDTGKRRGAAYGRMSCEDPNLQQASARDKVIAPLVRSQLAAEPGSKYLVADYSQQEPRWITHFAELCELPRAAEAAERYRTDPDTDNHQMMADMTGLDRSPAKIVYLGLCYGEGGVKLCQDLGLPTKVVEKTIRGTDRTYFKEVPGDEGQRILDQFDAEAPFIRKLARLHSDRAAQRGFIRTVMGRKCRFPPDSLGNYDWTHKALNRNIQGSSGDQTKAALVALDEAGYYLQLQVHDELDGCVQCRKEALAWADIMANVVPARVPFKVDIELGSSWGTAS